MISTAGSALGTARTLLAQFIQRTGLPGTGRPPVRYLWTDAFAVCTLLELFRRTGDPQFRHQALELIGQVHAVLGRHRSDDPRHGWISGLDQRTGSHHPTAGGLRIGKALTERTAREPLDPAREWDRDGQYFHYLTKWMHALNQAALRTGEVRYLRQAIELAKAAHRGFTYALAGAWAPRMYWKMSIDLHRPLVPSMGHHDPLDALVTYRELQSTAQRLSVGADCPGLSGEISTAEAMCAGHSWATDDPLGTGGLLFDACRVAQLHLQGAIAGNRLLHELLRSAGQGLGAFVRCGTVAVPPEFRLAFRELGLSIGLHALVRTGELLDEHRSRFSGAQELVGLVDDLQRFRSLGPMIEQFWLDSANRRSHSWIDHQDINTVMLATSLVPDGFLRLDQEGGKALAGSAHPSCH